MLCYARGYPNETTVAANPADKTTQQGKAAARSSGIPKIITNQLSSLNGSPLEALLSGYRWEDLIGDLIAELVVDLF